MEWVWVGAIAAGLCLFMLAIELLSRFASSAATALLDDEVGDAEGEPQHSDDSDWS